RYNWRIQDHIQMHFCRVVCWLIGVRIHVHGQLPGKSPRLVISNHISWTDIIALASCYPLIFLSKSEVRSWPILGLLARLQGTVFVDRADRADVSRANKSLTAVMRQSRDVVLFAEGTSSDGARVLPFRAAHFAPARDLSMRGEAASTPTLAPIAILYASGTKLIDVGWYGDMTFVPHLWRLMGLGGVCCHIFCGEQIYAGLTDRKKLAAEAEARVRRLHSMGRKHIIGADKSPAPAVLSPST
ncbi:MAG: 1-acyl-sn-glycerol-3-phosphate acyltransferase, partial [Methylocystis sp.]|nr:1-acyl-sn-glycerol-3-phosphate acyltransferase [Methylocystis sp.]